MVHMMLKDGRFISNRFRAVHLWGVQTDQHTHTHVHTHTRTHTHTHTHTRTRTRTHTHTCTYTHTNTHTYSVGRALPDYFYSLYVTCKIGRQSFLILFVFFSFLDKSARFRLQPLACPFLCVYVSVKIVCIGHALALITNVKNGVCRYWHFPSNGVIVKIVLRDFDLLFEGQQFKIVICLKR